MSVDGRCWCLPIEPTEAGDKDKLTDIDLKQKLRQLDVAVGLSSCEGRGYRCWGDSFAGVEEESKGNCYWWLFFFFVFVCKLLSSLPILYSFSCQCIW